MYNHQNKMLFTGIQLIFNRFEIVSSKDRKQNDLP